MKTKSYNPRNAGKLGKKRSKAFCIAQSHRMKGLAKSPETRVRMRKAAALRWVDPLYRAKHSKIMKARWAAVHKAEKLIAKLLRKKKSK